MKNVIDVADYISKRYKREFGCDIDEMKLHKLMYFAQRESYVINDEPLFDSTFYGWRYGPVLKEVRNYYKSRSSFRTEDLQNDSNFVAVMNPVFERYAAKDSWSLSRLTHGELSWQNSREGISEDSRGDVPIKNSDIRKDAQRIKSRMSLFSTVGA